METNLRTLGPNEAKVVLSLRERNSEVVRATDIIGILGSEPTARKVVRNLVRKGWLSRLVGGRYMFLPPEHGPENLGENNVLALAGAVIDPSYVGWWAAASFHGLTTQKPLSIAVAVLRQVPARTIEGADIRFVTLTRRKFFGFARYDVYGRQVALSTPAKTVVDVLNGGNTAGLAGQVSAAVTSGGYQAGLVENTTPLPSTEVLYGTGEAANAAKLAAAFGVTATASAAVAASHIEIKLGAATTSAPVISSASGTTSAAAATSSPSPVIPTSGAQGGAVGAQKGIPCVN